MQTNEAVRHVDDVNDWKTFHNSMAAVETIVVVTAVTGNENSGDHPTIDWIIPDRKYTATTWITR